MKNNVLALKACTLFLVNGIIIFFNEIDRGIYVYLKIRRLE